MGNDPRLKIGDMDATGQDVIAQGLAMFLSEVRGKEERKASRPKDVTLRTRLRPITLLYMAGALTLTHNPTSHKSTQQKANSTA